MNNASIDRSHWRVALLIIALVAVTLGCATRCLAAPVAQNDAYAVYAENVLTVTAANGVLVNDSNAGGGPITAVQSTGTVHGVVSFNTDGSFSYAPASGFSGTDSFTYRASDGTVLSIAATVTITVNPALFTAQSDAYAVYAENVLSVDAAHGVLANDTNISGGPITATLRTGTAHGVLNLNADGSLSYAPTPGFSGTDSFTYRDTNGTVVSNYVTVNITINPALFTAVNDAFSVYAENVLTVDAAHGVLANDTNNSGGPITAVLRTGPAHGVWHFNADGSFNYTPTSGFSGTDSFTYRATNGTVVSNYATVNITIYPALFTAQNDAYAVPTATTLTVDAAHGVLVNDLNNSGGPITAVLRTGPAHGLWQFNADGSFSYTPTAGFNGTDTFTYRATNGAIVSNFATVSINVYSGQCAAPTFTPAAGTYPGAQSVSISTSTPGAAIRYTTDGSMPSGSNGIIYSVGVNINADSTLRAFAYLSGKADSPVTSAAYAIITPPTAISNQNVSGNQDTDIPLTLAGSDAHQLPLSFTVVANPGHGTLSGAAPNLTYTPNAGYFGGDSFTFKVNNGYLDSTTATVSISVNETVAAVNDYYGLYRNTKLIIAMPGVLGNDLKANADPLTAILMQGTSNGAFTLNSNGGLSYTPQADFIGYDAFTYKAHWDGIDSKTATVTIQVASPPSGKFQRVSHPANQQPSNNRSFGSAVSGDGHYIVFTSDASNLTDTTNSLIGLTSVYRYTSATDDTGAITRVSVGIDANGNAVAPDDESWDAAVNTDGSLVAFASDATNLLPGGTTNGKTNIFLRNFVQNTNTLINVPTAGGLANDASWGPSISGDGRYIAFVSDASNLVAGDTNNCSDIFLRDLQAGVTTRLSVMPDGTQGDANSDDPAISTDGHYVVFVSDASTFGVSNPDHLARIYLADTQAHTLTCLCRAVDGAAANARSWGPAISADGSYIAFVSDASNLVPGDINGHTDVFLYTRATGKLTLASIASDGTQGDANSWETAISGDGHYVAFTTDAANLFANDTNHGSDVFLYDRLLGAMSHVTGASGNADSWNLALSADGTRLSFRSLATDLIENDTLKSTYEDVFTWLMDGH